MVSADDGGTEGGLRARKKERVREHLVEAAFELFAKNGYEATTIDDVTRACDVSRRTFFRYFRSKEDVVTAWLEDDRGRLREALEARPLDEPVVESLRNALTFVAGGTQSEKRILLGLLEKYPEIRAGKLARIERHVQVLAEVLAKRMGLDAKKDLAPLLLARVAIAAASSAVDTWLAGGAHASLPKLVDEALRFVERGELPASARAPRRVARAKERA